MIATFKLSPNANLNAQVSRGFRLGGINDPLNAPLCTPQDLVTFDGVAACASAVADQAATLASKIASKAPA